MTAPKCVAMMGTSHHWLEKENTSSPHPVIAGVVISHGDRQTDSAVLPVNSLGEKSLAGLMA